MAQISNQIEAYVGRRVDFIDEVELVQQDDDSIKITKWNVEGKSKPTTDQLAAVDAAADAAVAAARLAATRRAAYPPISDQLDMQYWDAKNGTTTWADAIAAVKAAHPKP